MAEYRACSATMHITLKEALSKRAAIVQTHQGFIVALSLPCNPTGGTGEYICKFVPLVTRTPQTGKATMMRKNRTCQDSTEHGACGREASTSELNAGT